MSRLFYLLAIVCLPLVVGCEGCRRDVDPEKDDEESAPLDAFTTGSPDPFPSAGVSTDDQTLASRGVKPGHWITASVAIKSNKDDARGELIARAGLSGADLQSGESRQNFDSIPSQRPVVLPKGQSRRFDYRILPPSVGGNQQKRCTLDGRFMSSGRGVLVDIAPTPFVAMESEEYFFVILTNRPERFAKIRKATWVKPFRDEFDFPISGANYRIITMSSKDVLPLSDTMLDWTNTAVVLWDDADTDVLTPDQQTAMADWIRFGGQLIVNGPDAADAISRGGLAGLLAMEPTGNIELDTDAAEKLLDGWRVATDTTTEQQAAILKSRAGRVAIDGEKNDDAIAIENTGELVLRRSVGRGLVVQPRFDVTSDWLVDWASFDSFFNAAILTRPHRRFTSTGEDGAVRLVDVASGSVTAEAGMNTRLRIASRDLRIGDLDANEQEVAGKDGVRKIDTAMGFRTDRVTGIGGWTESSDIVKELRQILGNESGIEIPKSSLVIRSLGYYLLILVPINFLVFRLLGRLEYAWLAVPLIAIIGAVFVARSARLDIGFARSQTELALLELHSDYPRGHLTRVDAIYNSLSSTYEIQFKTAGGCAMPMQSLQTNIDAGDPIFKMSYQEGPSLSDFAVGSNQVRLVHSEQMVDVGGAIRVDANGDLVNDSPLEIADAFVIEKADDGTSRVAVVGSVLPESSEGLRFRDSANIAVSDELPMQTTGLIRQLASAKNMTAGSMRLVGRIDGPMDGMSIGPKANQVMAQTLVLVHLKHSTPAPTRPDANLRSDLSSRDLSNRDLSSRDLLKQAPINEFGDIP